MVEDENETTTYFHLKIPHDLLESVRELAEKEHRTITGQMIVILTNHFAKEK